MKLSRLAKSPRTWIVALALAVVASELVLRSRGFGRFVMTYSSARYGWRYPPGLEYVDAPIPVTIRINDHGFRDDDFGPARPDPSVLRVATIGNSIPWGGGGLELEERFDRALASELRAELARRGDPRSVQTFDFAIPGYAFEQSARVYEDDVRPFRPDVVIAALLHVDVRPMRQMQDAPRYPFSDFVRRSALRDWLQRRFMGGWGAGVTDEQRAIENAVRADPFAPEHDALWGATFVRLDGLRRQVEADGGELVVVSLATLEEVLGTRAERSADRIGPWAQGRGVAHVDLTPEFAREMQPLVAEVAARGLAAGAVWGRARAPEPPALEHAATSCFFFHDPDHYSPRGHAVLSAALARELSRLTLR